MRAHSFAPRLRAIPLCMLLAVVAGCGGDAPKPPPVVFSDARLSEAVPADLDRLRQVGGDEVIVAEENDDKLAIYLGAANVANPDKINDVLPTVARIPNIARLYLTGTPVTDAGLAAVAKMQTLETINLDGSKITDAGLEVLGELPNLKTIFCRNTKVTVAGAGKLREGKGILVTH